MNKLEILRKSREDYSEKDGILKEHFKNVRFILVAVLVAAAFLFWLDAKFLDGSLVTEGVSFLVWVIIIAEDLYCFYISRKKIWLFLGIIGAIDVVLRGYLLFDSFKNFV